MIPRLARLCLAALVPLFTLCGGPLPPPTTWAPARAPAGRTVRVAAGQRLPDLSGVRDVVFGDGDHRPFSLSGARGITFRAEHPGRARIVGSVAPDGETPAAVRVHDGCSDLAFEDLEIAGSAGRGFRATASAGITLRRDLCDDNLIEGAIVGNCPRFVAEGCTFRDNGRRARSERDRSHGLYISGDSSGWVVRSCRFLTNSGSGLQVNGASLGYVIRNGLLEDCVFEGNGTDGTPALSLIAVRSSLFRRFSMRGNNAGVTLFDDGQGSRFACFDNRFEDFTIQGGKWEFRPLAGSGGNLVRPGAGSGGSA